MYNGRNDATKELIKTRPSNSSTRREYARMREEKNLKSLQSNATVVVHEDKPEPRKSISLEEAIKLQSSEPEVKTFPFVDNVYGANQSDAKAVEAKEHPTHKHGARLCMMSAIIHMKVLAERRAKSIKQLRKNPKTSLDEKLLTSDKSCHDDIESEEEDDVSKLRKCRYLRGVDEDKELTIEEIFG